MEAIIKLTRNKIAVVNQSDFEWLNQWKWCIFNGGYAVRSQWNKETKEYERILMHQLILPPHPGLQVDHINGDKLDNRRENLRMASPSQNQWNKGVNKNNKSGYKGVSWSGVSQKWLSRITKNYRVIHIGLFESKEAAAKAYNQAAVKHFGEYARLNEVPNA